MSICSSKSIKSIVTLYNASQLVWQASPKLAIASVIIVLIQSILPAVLIYLVKKIIDTLTLGLSSQIEQPNIWLYVGFFSAITLLSYLLNQLAILIEDYQSTTVTDHITHIIHQKSATIDYSYYENPEFFNTLHIVQEESLQRPQQIITSLLAASKSILTLLAISWLLFSLAWFAPLLLLSSAIVTMGITIYFSKINYQWKIKRTTMNRESNYLNHLLTHKSAAKELRIYRLGQWLTKHFNHYRKILRQEQLSLNKKQLTYSTLSHLLIVIVNITILIFLIHQVNAGILTIGDIVMYLQSIQMVQFMLRTAISHIAKLYESHLFLQHYETFIKLKSAPKSSSKIHSFPQPIQQGIQFKDVSFRFSGQQHNILDHLNFTIKAQETIALVGENGAGKTTLIKLLTNLYQPTQGSISVDNIDFNHIDDDSLHDAIGVVFQDYMRYWFTVEENIHFGKIDSAAEPPLIENAAQQAGIDDFIKTLANGYQTRLGKVLTGEQDLSDGQWQKLVMARVFYRDAQLIILDEPSSNLDVYSEQKIFEQFKKVMQNRTAIIISHRMSSIKMVDRILVLKDHTIVEQGSHQELMQQQGVYYKMYMTQAQQYQEN